MDAQGVKLERTGRPGFAARPPLPRTVQTQLDNRLAGLSPGGEADSGDTIVAGMRGDCPHRPRSRR
ncbi:hypothetical protein ABTX62_16740 [Streptomyces sp. NPDC096046]|uniref:hypothetical protein n=1 Tax=Streptomyces sp. NPDC096046 TaxID=3155542 RepID=UPI0033169A26